MFYTRSLPHNIVRQILIAKRKAAPFFGAASL
jgi:hypothetical protein